MTTSAGTTLQYIPDDMNASVAYLKAHGVKLIGTPIEHKSGPNACLTGVYFETP